MSEMIPPPEDSRKTVQQEADISSSTESDGVGKLGGCGLGLVLLVLTMVTAACARGVEVVYIGVAIALISLFFKGYRFVFVGFALPVGLLFLATVVFCANIHR